MDQTNYQSGLASLFATAARQPTDEPETPVEEQKPLNICWWCLDLGPDDHVNVYGTLILASHTQCMRNAERAEKAKTSHVD